jgi:hypothetical protein
MIFLKYTRSTLVLEYTGSLAVVQKRQEAQYTVAGIPVCEETLSINFSVSIEILLLRPNLS